MEPVLTEAGIASLLHPHGGLEDLNIQLQLLGKRISRPTGRGRDQATQRFVRLSDRSRVVEFIVIPPVFAALDAAPTGSIVTIERVERTGFMRFNERKLIIVQVGRVQDHPIEVVGRPKCRMARLPEDWAKHLERGPCTHRTTETNDPRHSFSLQGHDHDQDQPGPSSIQAQAILRELFAGDDGRPTLDWGPDELEEPLGDDPSGSPGARSPAQASSPGHSPCPTGDAEAGRSSDEEAAASDASRRGAGPESESGPDEVDRDSPSPGESSPRLDDGDDEEMDDGAPGSLSPDGRSQSEQDQDELESDASKSDNSFRSFAMLLARKRKSVHAILSSDSDVSDASSLTDRVRGAGRVRELRRPTADNRDSSAGCRPGAVNGPSPWLPLGRRAQPQTFLRDIARHPCQRLEGGVFIGHVIGRLSRWGPRRRADGRIVVELRDDRGQNVRLYLHLHHDPQAYDALKASWGVSPLVQVSYVRLFGHRRLWSTKRTHIVRLAE